MYIKINEFKQTQNHPEIHAEGEVGAHMIFTPIYTN